MSATLPTEKLRRLEIMLDRQDILDCLTRFSRGIDRFDRDVFLSAFHSDATIAAGPFVGGPEALYDWAMPMHEQGQIATQHQLGNHSCEIDGDSAHAETYYTFIGRNRDHSNWIAGGRYIDRLERKNEEWKIALRTNLVEWSGMLPTMEIPFADIAGIELNGLASRSKSDPSYMRPLVNRRHLNLP